MFGRRWSASNPLPLANYPVHVRPAHAIGFALVIALVACWHYASTAADATTAAFNGVLSEPSVMVPLDDDLRPTCQIVEVGGRHFAVCPVPAAAFSSAGSHPQDALAPATETGWNGWASERVPRASSFVALCASALYWLTGAGRARNRGRS